jgi:hypothetical protein
LTARVLVNRLWRHHFGAGLVPTLDNFGKVGARPTHPTLLDWLALEFVRRGWSLKAMHRLMVTSAVYRQSSTGSPASERLDPAGALYSRMLAARLDAESLSDTLLRVAGRLDEARYGPPDPVVARPDGLITPVATERGWRRSIYVRQQRKQLPTLLEDFDLPQMNPNCIDRRNATVAPQALHLWNNGMVQALAEHFARRVRREAGPDPARQLERAYRIALSRPPGPEEHAVGLTALARLTDQWARLAQSPARPDHQPDDAAVKALANLCHALINSAGFLYID